ncbi:MAG: hypothetical protein ACLUFV_12115 [Acutalibacteraceae bacterium]
MTAVVLAVLTITLSCALLFADDNGGGLFTPGSTQGTTSTGADGSEIKQTVGITEASGQTYDVKALYEKCPSPVRPSAPPSETAIRSAAALSSPRTATSSPTTM